MIVFPVCSFHDIFFLKKILFSFSVFVFFLYISCALGVCWFLMKSDIKKVFYVLSFFSGFEKHVFLSLKTKKKKCFQRHYQT
jgi:hypothetical protein